MLILLVAVLLGALPLLTATPATAAPADPVAIEADFVARINDLRAAEGLSPLVVHDELVTVARGWAANMAAADEISHNPGLSRVVSADWQKLGENVGVGMTVPKLHDAFVRSPAHHRNLVDPDFTHVGVGVVVGRDGALFTAHQFMKLRPGAAPLPARPQPAVELVSVSTAPRPVAVAPARLMLVLQQLRDLDAR